MLYAAMLFSILEGKGMELSWPLTEPLVLALAKYRLEKGQKLFAFEWENPNRGS